MKPLGSRPRRSYSSGLILAAYLAPGFTTIGNITEADGRRWRADLLDESVSPVTTAKAYRLLKSILAAVRISRQLTEARGQAAFFAPPKTAASKRRVILPGSRRLPVTLVPATPRSRQPDRGTRSARLTEARPRASTPGRTVAAMRSAIRAATGCGSDLEVLGGAGDGNRTRMTSLEGWGSAIELRPRYGSRRRLQHTGRRLRAARRCSAPPPYPPDSRRADGPRSRAMPCRQALVPGRERVGFACRTGCSAAWLARLLWEQEAAGSNPAIPTKRPAERYPGSQPATVGR